MGPQLFPSIPGISSTKHQTGNGLSPLDILLAKPIQFVREISTSSKRKEPDDLIGNNAKRRKVMSLAEYLERKAGTFVEEPVTKEPVKMVQEEDKDSHKNIQNVNYLKADKDITLEIVIPGVEFDSSPAVALIPPPEEEVPSSSEALHSKDAEGNPSGTPQKPSESMPVFYGPEDAWKRGSRPPDLQGESPLKRMKVMGSEDTGTALAISTNYQMLPEHKEDTEINLFSTPVQKSDNILNASKLKVTPNNSDPKNNKRKRDEISDALIRPSGGKQGKFWKEFPEGFSGSKAKGIFNKGLWCYRNSIIQAIVHIPQVYDFLTNHHTQEKCKRTLPTCICCLLSFFARTHFDNDSTVSKRLKALEQIDKLLGGEFAKTGFRHDQQDADEYAIRMLDKAVEQLKNGDKNVRTPLEDLLEITTAQSVICRNCKHRSLTKSHSTSVRAKMPKGQPVVSLKDLVNDLSGAEPIKDYKCEKCGKLGAIIRRRFTELPPALMVHVNRGGKANFRGQSVKLNNWVKFDPELTIQTGDGVSHKYLLRSVVSHMGQTLNSGHYVCFVKNPSQQTWSICDDSNVSQTSDVKFRGSKDCKPQFSAYILMYTKA